MSHDDALDSHKDGFDPVWYLRTYDDVRKAGIDPWHHYSTSGKREGRQGKPLRSLDLDHMLWRGFETTALPGLQALSRSDEPREVAVAAWSLARWYVEQGETRAARDSIALFHMQPEADQVLRHIGPWLLAVELYLACDEIKAAGEILAQGRARHGACADFDLAEFLCISARAEHAGHDAHDEVLNRPLAAIHARENLASIALQAGAGSRFDRIHVPQPPESVEDGPLVSVIMPVYNAAGMMIHAIKSLQSQSWRNLEIVIVDDASADDSRAVAQAQAAQDARIRLIALPHNQGAYAARNAGLAAAQGDFFTVHDADDWSHPDKIRLQVEALVATPAASASVSHMVRASADLDMTRWRIENGWTYRNTSSLMMRIGLRDRLGFWDRARVSADTEYYHRIRAADGPGAILEVLEGVPLMLARTTPQSLTQRTDTHLRSQFTGVRRDYINAAQQWHRQAQGDSDLFVPQIPEVRPFRIPQTLAGDDPQPPEGPIDILRGSPLFDAQWYQLGNLDVLFADMDPALHYLQGGARENRDPGPRFSTGGVRLDQKLGEDDNPLLHWHAQGADESAALPRFEGAHKGKPRVVVFAHSAGKTLFGAERSLLDVVARMAARGDAPVVVLPTLRDPGYLDRLLPICAAVEILPQIWRYGLRAPHPQTVAGARRLIEKYRPDEVHVNTLVLDAPLVAARAAGYETVVHVRELPAQDAPLCRVLGTDPETLRRDLLAQADRFIANSPVVAGWLNVPERTMICPNSVSPALFDLPFTPGKHLNVALISSNVVKKGIADFLSVARQAQAAGSPMRFLLIGPPSPDLHMLRPWSDNVEFRGYAASPEEAIAQADVVVSLSHFAESFGRTVLEAMAAGRPVVCYDRGAPPSLIRSGETGFVVPADDTGRVLQALLALEAARGQLFVMSEAARTRAHALQKLAEREIV